MSHESFENEEVARILNENFVSIKVDREERPDVDKVYMTFIQVSFSRFFSGKFWNLVLRLLYYDNYISLRYFFLFHELLL